MKEYWYAVQIDEEDNNWDRGSYCLITAKREAEKIGPDAKIAVIDEGDGHDPICVHVLRQDEYGSWKNEEGRYR